MESYRDWQKNNEQSCEKNARAFAPRIDFLDNTHIIIRFYQKIDLRAVSVDLNRLLTKCHFFT